MISSLLSLISFIFPFLRKFSVSLSHCYCVAGQDDVFLSHCCCVAGQDDAAVVSLMLLLLLCLMMHMTIGRADS